MDWKSQLIIVRPIKNGVVALVNEPATLKDARYWLNYIAEPFDALHFTPLSPKYTGSGTPQYSCHLIQRAKTDYNEKAWRERVFEGGEQGDIAFVSSIEKKFSKSDNEKSAFTETDIITLADGKPKNLSLSQIQAILNFSKKNLDVILFEPSKWINWESAMTLMTRDVHVTAITSDPKWPMAVSLNPKSEKGETMNYDKEMKFIVKAQ